MAGQGTRRGVNPLSGDEFIPGLLKKAGNSSTGLQKISTDPNFGASTSNHSFNQENCPTSINSSPLIDLTKSVSEFGSVQESRHGRNPRGKNLNLAMNQIAAIFEYLVRSKNKSPSRHRNAPDNQREVIQETREESCVYEITCKRAVVETVKMFKKCSEESEGSNMCDNSAPAPVLFPNVVALKPSNGNSPANIGNGDYTVRDMSSVTNGGSFPRSASRLSNQSVVFLSPQETEKRKLIERRGNASVDGTNGSVDHSEEGTGSLPPASGRSLEELDGRSDKNNEIARDSSIKRDRSNIDITRDPSLKNDEDPLTADAESESIDLNPRVRQRCLELVKEYIRQQTQRSCDEWCNLNSEERDECLRVIMKMRCLNSDVLFFGKTYPSEEEIAKLRRKRKIKNKEQPIMVDEEPKEKRLAVIQLIQLDEEVGPVKENIEAIESEDCTEI